MANYRAVANGNWNTGSTWAGGAVPPNGQGHNIYSNTFTVTIDIDVDVALITNAAFAGTFVGGGTAAMGGYFELANGVTVTGNIIRGSSVTHAFTLLISATNSANIVGNISSQSGISGGGNSSCFQINTSGTVNITGNVTGGDIAQSAGIFTASPATINITGNVTAGSGGNSSNAWARGIQSTGVGHINVTGSVSGGTLNTGQIGIQHGNGNLSVVGSVTAGNTLGSYGISTGSGNINIVGNITATNATNGVLATGNGNTIFSGNFIASANGTAAIYCPQYRVSPAPLNARTRYAANGTGTYVDMFTADNAFGQASPTDVRSGVSYASGVLTGRLTVPSRGSVSLNVNYGPSMPFTATRSGTTATATLAYSYPLVVGDTITVAGASNTEWNSTYTIASVVSGTSVTFTVPATHSSSAGVGATMQTTGTAVLDPTAVASAVWGAASRTITGGLVDTATTLTNSPDVPTESEIAVAVRTELSTELGRLDATVSSRLAPSGTLATVTTLTNAPTSVTPAQIRAEMDANSTKLANLDATISSRLATSAYTAPTAAPTAAQNATAVWGAATKEITGGTVTTLTNAPSVPSAASIRAEIDSNSTQLAAIKTKTDNLPASPAATGDIPSANISAIKAKTDLLNTDRLAQVSTVSTTGAQLAAALS
jgi:hypothetical protein